MFLEGMIFGNATSDEAVALVDLITTRFAGAALEQDLRNTNRLVRLPYGAEIRLARGVWMLHLLPLLSSSTLSLSTAVCVNSCGFVHSPAPVHDCS
jgi:hypothetical protein